MGVNWMRREAEEADNKDNLSGIEIKPEKIREAIAGDLDELKNSSKAMMDFINQQKEERAEAQRVAAERQRAESSRQEPVDFFTDPETAMNNKLRPLAESNAVMASMFVRRELLEKEDYYGDPEFKKHVDAIIDSQPLAARSNAAVIMNAYKIARFDKQKEIEEGKIKSSLSISGGRGSGRSDIAEEESDGGISMSQQEKAYARKLGISESDWVSQKKNMEYV